MKLKSLFVFLMALSAIFCVSSYAAPMVDCSTLRTDNGAPRWLSAPYSRLVVNPTGWFGGAAPDEAAPRELSDSLSTGLGYSVGEYPVRLPTFWNWSVGSDTEKKSLVETGHTWFPHKIVVSAKTIEQPGEVETVTCLSDNSTVCQLLKVRSIESHTLFLRGYLARGEIIWNEEKQALTLKRDLFSVTVTFSRRVRWLGESKVNEELDTWYQQKIQAVGGIWSVAFDGVKPGAEIVVSARFRLAAECDESEVTPTIVSPSAAAFRKTVKDSEANWNRELQSVPHPTNFTLRLIDSKSVTPDRIRQMYYRAWAFLIGDILPPMPERGYLYPQFATGKSSLWAGGHAKAPESAQWESFFAMQLYALVDPECAWQAFEGMMSLVDEQGTFNGESLPSRHVQTAWVLYSLTGDKSRLKLVYPAMKRLLVWKASDPRWLYMNLTAEGTKDADFVVSALMDMQYMIRVCRALDMSQEVDYWNNQIRELADNYHRWFFPRPGGEAYLVYSEKDQENVPHGKSRTWCLQGITLPPGILWRSDRNTLLSLYRSEMNKDTPFLISYFSKYPHQQFLADGLSFYGFYDDASIIGETAMRDVARAGDFGEVYSEAECPKAEGVVPSVFGAANIIDFTLRHNGVAVSDGLPALINLPDTSGGVCGMRIFGKDLNVKCDSSAGVTVWGGALGRFEMPHGFSAAKSDALYCWKGRLNIGERVTLSQN
ncbi:MAG: hypothetical protein ABFD49_11035 [Armatimonadota bacterium]|nr:hypothetical protein [bacterium]